MHLLTTRNGSACEVGMIDDASPDINDVDCPECLIEHRLHEWTNEITELIEAIKADLDDEVTEVQITVATDDDLSRWVYQTGDNSFAGSCYMMPHWGVSYITRDCKPEDIVTDLLGELRDSWESNPANAHGW